jgi:hypothetical protein
VDGDDGEGIYHEGSGAKGRAACMGEGRVAGMACFADTARAGGDAMGGRDAGEASSGNSGSMGRAGMSRGAASRWAIAWLVPVGMAMQSMAV